jgi:hypothetical protein
VVIAPRTSAARKQAVDVDPNDPDALRALIKEVGDTIGTHRPASFDDVLR